MPVSSLSAWNVQQDRGPSSDEAAEKQYMSSNNANSIFGDEKKNNEQFSLTACSHL